MTALAALLAAGTGGVQTTVTVGNSSSIFGFSQGSFGSISPVITTPISGSTIVVLESQAGAFDFTFHVSGYAGTQTGAFTQIVVQTTAGGFNTYTAASAGTYASGVWTWGSGSSPAWTATGTRTLTIS